MKLPENVQGVDIETPPEQPPVDRVTSPEPAFEFQKPAQEEAAFEQAPSRTEQISTTTSIEELCNVIANHDENASEVIERIRAAQAYLDQHINEIIVGVVNGGNEGVRQDFGRAVDAIGDPLVVAHVKALMKEQMKSYFEADKKAKGKELARQALAQSQSFDELYKTIRLYRDLEGVNYHNEVAPRYAPEEVINQIDVLRLELTRRFAQGIVESDLGRVDAAINEIVEANQVITDVGLAKKISELLMSEIRQQRLEIKATQLAQPSMLSRWGSKVMGWFGRKK